jgi:hypothetical protein
MPDPKPSVMFDQVYEEMTPLLREQAAAFESYHAGFTGGGH